MSLTRRPIGPPATQPPIPRGQLRKQLAERMMMQDAAHAGALKKVVAVPLKKA